MFFKASNYIKGYLAITIEGTFPERFINLCAKNNIELWNIRRLSKNSLTACIRTSGFKKIRKYCKKTKCKVHITKKCGLRFLIYRYRKRKALFAGFAIFFIILWALTKFVWVIEISGNEKLADSFIIEQAKKAGLYQGMPTSAVNIRNIQHHILTNVDDIVFVTINKKGTTVYIDIREREEKRQHFDKNTPTNIIAKESGVIESVLVQSGTASVKKGDIVCKGQLLVSGASDNKFYGIKYSNSDAAIKARVWHEETVNLPYYKEHKTPTGKQQNKNKILFFNFSINLFLKNKILFENYDILSYTNYISLGGEKKLPIGIETNCYKEYIIKRTKLSTQQTKDYIVSQMNDKYKDSEIVSRSFEIKNNKLTVTFECIEEIGLEEELNDNGKVSGS